jgi:hypothetical protein
VFNEQQQNKDSERLSRMANVISKFASTLTLRKVHVEVDTQGTFATEAWSDAETITFNGNRLKNLDTIEGIAGIKGLGLHEVSHILLTPRMGSNIRKWVNANNYQRAFNALEDQRIETFMTHKFSNVNEWLTITISQFLLNNAKAYPLLFPILAGRKYLPVQLRDSLRAVYVDQVNVQELADIIDKYTVLNLSDSSHIPIAMKLIERYHELVNTGIPQESAYQPGGFNKIPDPHGHDCRKDNELKSSEKSKPMNKAGQEKIIERILNKRSQQPQPSGSEEGEEYELGESESRVDEIYGLLPFFEMISAINAKAISTIQLQDIETEDVSDIEPDLMEGLYQQVSFAALVAAFSAALELGFLNKSYDFLSIYGGNKEDEDE